MYCGSTADAFISLGVKNIELAIEWEERIVGDNKSK